MWSTGAPILFPPIRIRGGASKPLEGDTSVAGTRVGRHFEMSLWKTFAYLLVLCVVLSAAETIECDSSRGIEVFEKAVRSGDWVCAKSYVAATPPSQLLALKAQFDLEQRRIVASMSELKSAIEVALPTSSIVPAFQWCQSPRQIFLNVKFAHKLDAPATLNVEIDNVEITSSRMHITASARKGSSKSFSLDLPLWAPIVIANSTYNLASVGRMTVTLLKEVGESKWPRLLARGFNAQQNLGKSVMHFWHEQHEKYADELDLLDDPDDDEDDKKRKAKARKDKAEKERKKAMEEAVRSGKAWSRDDNSTLDDADGSAESQANNNKQETEGANSIEIEALQKSDEKGNDATAKQEL